MGMLQLGNTKFSFKRRQRALGQVKPIPAFSATRVAIQTRFRWFTWS